MLGTMIVGLRILRWQHCGRTRALTLRPLDQAEQIIAIWSIGAESFFVEQALDATAQTHLIGMILRSHRPAHAAMPASAKQKNGCTRDSSGHNSQRP